MSALILHEPEITFDLVTAGTPAGTPEDVSCHINRVEITVDQDEKDVGTFCKPGATEPGPPNYGADVDWRLQRDEAGAPDGTSVLLAIYVGKTVRVQMRSQGSDTDGLTFSVDFGVVNPGNIGSWEAGEVVETSTSHEVESDWSSWVAVTP
jgi:hypothetical protein